LRFSPVATACLDRAGLGGNITRQVLAQRRLGVTPLLEPTARTAAPVAA
jgi:hypothetical protein